MVTSMASASSRASSAFSLELRADRLDLFLDGRADVVRGLTHDGALLCGQLAHRLQNAGQLALLAEKAHAQRVQLTGVLGAVQRAERFLPDLFQLFFHNRMLLFRHNTKK